MYNPNHNYTDDELISMVYSSAGATALELELAQRLESVINELEEAVVKAKQVEDNAVKIAKDKGRPKIRIVQDCV